MIYLQDPDVTIHQGDALELLKGLPDGSVHMACTSPPFYGLRDYQTGRWEGGRPDCDHMLDARGGHLHESPASIRGGAQAPREAQKTPFLGDTCGKCGATRVDQQIGLEATPDEWVTALVDVFRELRRVLRDDGQLWIEVGDSYAGSWGAQSRENGTGAESLSAGQITAHPAGTRTGSIPPGSPFKPKDLIGAPWLLAFALRNDGWFLRSEIIWAKPNPMPESVSDRPTQSHSRVFLLTKQARYFYDAEAIREPADYGRRDWNGGVNFKGGDITKGHGGTSVTGADPSAGRNRRSVWTIPTEPYPEAHFATWPTRLVEPMILAGTSERGVCPVCGAPWERVTEGGEGTYAIRKALGYDKAQNMKVGGHEGGHSGIHPPGMNRDLTPEPAKTTGWQPTCDCGEGGGPVAVADGAIDPGSTAPVPAVVLDPFGGAGTTAVVARKHGRRAILLELNEEYCALAAKRLAQQSLFATEPA